MIELTINNTIATIALDDPDRRNALSIEMFDALDGGLDSLTVRGDVHVVQLRGKGKAFCAGFDLPAAIEDITLLETMIRRLSMTMRKLRRMPMPVVVCVHGAAIAGGCALVSAADVVVVSADAKLGYPVHRIGVSPAVTIPTLQQAITSGAARELVMSGEIIDGRKAHAIGLAHEVANSDDAAFELADKICETIAGHGPVAVRATKSWLNELDGSSRDDDFDRAMNGCADAARDEEAAAMLNAFWQARARK